ncbi:MAG: AraC family transcriptional regulator [Polyangiales bacterium]
MTSVSMATDWRPESTFLEDSQSFTASTARVSVRLLAPFVSAAQELGLRVDVGLAGVGLSRSDLDNPDLRVSHALADRMLRGALIQSGERDLGLLAAEHLQPDHLDVVEYTARSQSTLRGAIEHSIRYYALLHDGFEAELHVTDDRAVFSVRFGSLPVADCMLEFTLAVQIMAARRMTGLHALTPLEVHFTHARPKSTLVHQRIFRCPVHFGQPQNAIVYPRSVLDAPLVSADVGLARVLERHAADALQKLGRSTSLPERVREIVRQDLTSGKLTADNLARRLGMSSRTLHRRLVAQASSYRAILDDVRREIALRCLRDPQLSIREVGYLLGFTTGPAFHRAFRRWTGTTAASFRGEFLRGRS